MNSKKYIKEVHDAYMNYYVPGFSGNNMAMIDKIVKYPIAHIQNGSVSMHDKYPIDLQQLKLEKEWNHTSDWKFEVTTANEKQAHVVASSTRRRKDNSIIENINAFYAFTKTNEGWKMFAISDIAF